MVNYFRYLGYKENPTAKHFVKGQNFTYLQLKWIGE